MKQLNTTATKLALAISLVLSIQVQAQLIPDVGDILQQVQPMTPMVTPSEAPLPAIGGLEIEPPMQVLPSGPTVFVKGFNIVGSREMSSDVSLSLIHGQVNQELTLSQLEGLATLITRNYRANGYFVARAYIPQQEVVEGIITIRVVEGNYGQFHLTNESLVKDSIVQAMLDDVKDYDIVSLDTLERAMLIINDTPGVQVVRADVMPGEAVGTSDFAVGTNATERYNGYLLADNYGSKYSGKQRVGFNYDINSPTSRGDRLTVGGLVTEEKAILNGRVAYSALLMPNGLRGELQYSYTDYDVINLPLDAGGTAKGWDLGFSYPIRRIRAQTIEGIINFSHKDLGNIQDTRRTQAVTAGINVRDERNIFGFDGLSTVRLSITSGDLAIRGRDDVVTRHEQGEYSKLNLNLSRISLLPHQFSLTTSMIGQYALNGKNIDSSEQMSVSGLSGVYAYPSAELSGSNAALFRAELRRPLPSFGMLRHQWSVFGSVAYASQAKNISISDGSRQIGDVGLGWRGQYENFVVNAHLAYRLEGSKPISEPVDRARFLIQAGWVF
ncbi:ShlB/FhaC/HecB family hemolysin secretion/activation protein [Nitrincola alkalisediminis]|uniref:ShlB/FhaC/HecB family hemolysin secretion/activation protein n=1 Tax=Nitrincola alkalisediminis TaxID=1366656 RepID=UPI0018739A5B|nr:ShlB/FhaC/HecB family hemolysin secretion/activation protein [Nitrincola alkalisediminis]